MSSYTVRKWLPQGGFYTPRPMMCFLLTSRNHAVRKSRAAIIRNWAQRHWSEDYFHWQVRIQSRVWHPAFSDMGRKGHFKEPHVYTKKITMQTRWIDGMGWNQHKETYWPAYYSKWHIVGLTVCNAILRSHIVSYALSIDDSFLLMLDNGRPHTVQFVEDSLETETIQHMTCPAC